MSTTRAQGSSAEHKGARAPSSTTEGEGSAEGAEAGPLWSWLSRRMEGGAAGAADPDDRDDYFRGRVQRKAAGSGAAAPPAATRSATAPRAVGEVLASGGAPLPE